MPSQFALDLLTYAVAGSIVVCSVFVSIWLLVKSLEKMARKNDETRLRTSLSKSTVTQQDVNRLEQKLEEVRHGRFGSMNTRNVAPAQTWPVFRTREHDVSRDKQKPKKAK